MNFKALFPSRLLQASFILLAMLSSVAPGVRATDRTTADAARVSASMTPSGGRITVEASGVQPVVPLFFTASIEQTVNLGPDEITGELKLGLNVVQGRAEVFSLGLVGDGEVLSVTGPGLRDWAVRSGTGDAAGLRFLVLRPALVEGQEGPRAFSLLVRTRLKVPTLPGKSSLLLLAPGEAVGFDAHLKLQAEATLDLRVTQATGVIAVGDPAAGVETAEFVAHGPSRIEVALMRRGAALGEVDLAGVQLTGRVNEGAASVDFRLRAQARVDRAGARLRVLAGRAALSEHSAGDGWHAELVEIDDGEGYDLVFERKGIIPVDLTFAAALGEKGDWRELAFAMPAGTVVPLTLAGLPEGVEFDPAAAVVLSATPAGAQGFLPANGHAALAWKRTREKSEGTLFFTSAEQTEVRVGAGMLRQAAQISFRVLQGKMAAVRLKLDGPGEIVGVDGTNVLGWKVLPAPEGTSRLLEVKLSRPFEGEAMLLVRSQSALGAFPVRAEPIRLTPEGGVRHAGFVRVANDGAVRLEVAETEGLMQLAPAQFPGPALEGGPRQVFVYRFPSAERNYRVLASQIMPEVGVAEVVTYELAETDRVIQADVELDVREAPLRDWSLGIPADYSVVAVQGAAVADYAVDGVAHDGRRALKILFGQAVEGRQLLKLRLEKNEPAGAGEWRLPPLVFPGAKSVRGHVGVVSAPGYRLVPASVRQLVEVPLSYFPKQVGGLQQAYRLREADWAAVIHIEALGQSVQADVFHLYSLKEGAVYASVLINYFVVGAPASEWRIEVPATAGNIDVTGQGVRRDWRREGNMVIVSLHQPVLGAATLLVTFEEPMSARGGSITPGEVRPLGVQAERGYLQVVSPLQVKNQIRKADGLLKLEPLELPAEFRLFTSSPSLAVYQYTARPFALELGVDWYQAGETVDQVIDFAKLTSQVSRDGQVVTDARFFVKTRGRKALRLELAEGVKLWEARVDREVVTARADDRATLVPLPAKLNPNEPVEVALRLGQAVGSSPTVVRLSVPRMSAPLVIGEWSLHSDAERLLVPQGGTAELSRSNLTERGFEWIAGRARAGAVILVLLIALGALALSASSGRWLMVGLAACGLAVCFSLSLAVEALANRRPNLPDVNYAASVVPTDAIISIEVGNVVPWRAMLSGWGLAAAVLGVAGLVVGRGRSGVARLASVSGLVLFSGGLLAQRLGAVWFFLAVAVGVLLFLFLPGAGRAWRTWREGKETGGESGVAASTVSLVMLACVLGGALVHAPMAVAAPPEDSPWAQPGAKTVQAMVQRWEVRNGRLYAEIDLTVRGLVGESFLLLKSPAVLTEFTGVGLRVGKIERDEAAAYFVTPERDGTLTGKAKFELPVADLSGGLPLLTGPAVLQRVTILLDQGGWEFTSPMAMQVQPTAGLPEGRSGATLVLGPGGDPVINLVPQRRNLTVEATQIFVEAANLYVPGPGVVNGYTRVSVRPVQGRVAALELEVPAGFTVGEVNGGPVGAWRFDPEKRRLHVAVEPAQSNAFSFMVEIQRGAAALPYELTLEPLRVNGAGVEVGTLALAFGGEAQPEEVKATGLSAVSVTDFDAALLPHGRDDQLLATLQSVYRYSREEGSVGLRVAPVAPEVRVTAKQVLSFGDDRLVLAADLGVAITRVGLFKLSFALPTGLEVETLSGPALSHWSEAEESGQRIVTLHLNGRTLGDQVFALTLVGPLPARIGPGGAANSAGWRVPRVLLREATRQTGELQLVPEKGIRLRALERTNVSEIDARTMGNVRPGVLAFRLLQDDWTLTVGIESLDPWVTVQALQEVTAREGQTLTRLSVRYRVENAAVKQVRLRLPGLSEEQARTVRATGPAVSDCVPVPGEPGRWEIRFQRGMVGETAVQVEFQGPAAREQAKEVVATPVFEGARQVVQFVAVRGGGRLDLEAAVLPRGWTRTDWSAVPVALQDRGDRSVPALAFRVAEPERPLEVTVRRHEIADALKLRVTSGGLITVLSPTGPALTAVALQVEVVEKSTLRVRLPDGAQLFNTFVNGESVSVVREGDAYLFHVAPNSAADRSAQVRLVYAVTRPQGGKIALLAPGLNVPLENVTWRVVLPAGFELADYSGSLQLNETQWGGSFELGDYQSLVVSKRAAEAKQATDFLVEANNLLQKGQQQQAGEVLSRVSNFKALDEATNEDARVQLRTLKTQQAVIGLNTRRQRLYLDNSADGVRNEQLEQAANANPFIKGKMDFDPQQLDQMLMGNTVEENTALRGIAGRIVDQQLAAEPAPGAIDVTVAERGQTLTFKRSLQVDGGAPLELRITLDHGRRAGLGFGLGLLAAVGAIGGFILRRRSPVA